MRYRIQVSHQCIGGIKLSGMPKVLASNMLLASHPMSLANCHNCAKSKNGHNHHPGPQLAISYILYTCKVPSV
ncbi:uncharacterized protein CANTADRAFT_216128 [Suhomyces tanzawaensis NRRL Y-17324]|uniref:Uncharacterized protein n=1 Tax=Suhomyces tanzawaensis NRRL Y-17324 TaxID=984487 RepID=A0A1E4SJU1_9ASCO|nr:uncharacterized protein CANTADRAFT_216128 [Suhomyces tanzawaensis NRRL Y-17324]ODV79769.1 hypothetical protein CANTADRAFT_216128 [Suhomyces tanzawaensis NRRL Y-17324]